MQFLMGIGKFQERVLILIDIHAALSSKEIMHHVAHATGDTARVAA
jgi:hypothetical protein